MRLYFVMNVIRPKSSWSRSPGVHIFEARFAVGDHEDRLESPAWNYFEVRVSQLYW